MSTSKLFTAIEDIDIRSVRLLVQSSPTLVNQSDDDHEPDQPLHIAVDGAGISLDASMIVTTLISAGADVNSRGANRATPLHIAVRHDLINTAIELVEAGANLDSRDGHGETPFGSIAHTTNYSCLGFLLARGASIDIYSATVFGRTDWAQWILRDNPDALRKDSRSSRLLCTAIEKNNLNILQLLISSGGATNSAPGSVTPLWRAVERNNIEAVRMLLEADADPNGCRPQTTLPDWRHPGWNSPLEIARERGLFEIENLLRQFGATE